jgi:hypothetical protein
MRKGQVAQELKFELVVPIDGDTPTACMSFNRHLDHFGRTWDLRMANSEIAHTACTGIGLERTTLALFRWHGPKVADWPKKVRMTLGLL